MGESAVAVALVYPDLLGTYGDGGNARILVERLRWRGIEAELVPVPLGTPLPATCHIYVLGGGEDAPQALAANQLRREGMLATAVERGAVVLAVCAGLQVIGTRFLTAGGLCEGAGIVDVETLRGLPKRAVGELAVDPDPSLGLPVLSGYENHAGLTRLGSDARPLGRVVSGVGNGTGTIDGCLAPNVLGTYLHGPVLARNPEVADVLLRWVIGELPSGNQQLVDADREAFGLRRERLSSLGRRPRWWGR